MVHQVYKNQNLTRTKVKNNILRIWKLTDGDERSDWYQEANLFATVLSKELPNYKEDKLLAKSKVCGIISALSPVKRWSENKKVAIDMVRTGDCGHMPLFKQKAKDILNCDGTDEAILSILNGNKISSFYLNIRYPKQSNILTIDRHALSIALGRWIKDEEYQGMTYKQYEFFVQCYTLAAIQVGVTPLVMQSATWVKWRKIKSEYR